MDTKSLSSKKVRSTQELSNYYFSINEKHARQLGATIFHIRVDMWQETKNIRRRRLSSVEDTSNFPSEVGKIYQDLLYARHLKQR